MNNLINSYPVFHPNQVLTHSNLNNIVNYLEQQQRLSRLCSVGMGIICGLEPAWDGESAALTISAGCGITSKGYLVHTDGLSFNRYESLRLNIGLLTDANTAASELTVLELVETDAEEESDHATLTLEVATAKVALLFFECKEDKNDLCGNNCDERGAAQEFKIRVFLLEEAGAKTWIGQFYQLAEENLESAFDGAYGKQRLYVERFGKNEVRSGESREKIGRLTGIVSYDKDFQPLYRAIITSIQERLNTFIADLNRTLQSIYFPLDLEDLVFNGLNAETISPLELQYQYDRLYDLVETYNELLDVVSEITAYCTPETAHFPKHLFLGKLFEPSRIYRTPYMQAPVYNGSAKLLYQARSLHRRFQMIADAEQYSVPSLETMVITPGKSSMYPLSERAIPFYYKNIAQVWNATLSRRGLSHRQYANPRLTLGSGNPPYDDPLIYSFLDQDFLRIEGHIGKPYDVVMQELDRLKMRYNLGFDIIYLKLGETFDEDAFQFECDNLEGEKAQYEKLYRACNQKAADAVNTVRAELQRVFPRVDVNQITNFDELEGTLSKPISDFQYNTFLTAYNQFTSQLQALVKAVSRLDNFNLSIDFPIIESSIQHDLRVFSTSYRKIDKQIQEIKEQHLFHCFAATHPGIEHRGGVPIGGTFLLVYVQSEETARLQSKGTVVADFYLPYSCCTNCPPVAYLVDRVVVNARVEPSVVCESTEEDRTYELELIATPPGGFLSGQGLSRQNGTYHFNPAQAEYINIETGEAIPPIVDPDTGEETKPTSGVARLTYTVDKASADVIIDVLAVPDATFSILNDDGQDIKEVCREEGQLVQLSPEEGTYTAFINNEEQDGLINEAYQINPMELDLGEEVELNLVIRKTVTDDTSLCEGIVEKVLVVKIVPDASFEMQFNGTATTDVCVDSENGVVLIPSVSGGEFTAMLADGSELESVIINNEINPGTLAEILGRRDAITIRISYELELGCGNSSAQTLTIRTPQPIQIQNPTSDRFCANRIISLQASSPNVVFKAERVEENGRTALTIGEGNTLDLSQLTFTEEQQIARIEIGAEAASNNFCLLPAEPVSITAFPAPTIECEASFEPSLTDDGTVENGSFVVAVQAASSSNELLQIEFNPEPVNLQTGRRGNWRALFNYEGTPVGREIQVNVFTETEQCGRVTDSKTITVIPLITGFHFFATQRNDDGEIAETLELENIRADLSSERDGEIPTSRFSELSLLNIQAITQPAEVGSVKLELNFLQDGSEPSLVKENSSASSNNYRLVENEEAPGVDPAVGTYTIKAVPFTEADEGGIEGQELQIQFEIFEQPVIFSNAGGRIERGMSLDALLNQRASNYRSSLNDLKGSVSKMRYGRSEAFLNYNASPEQLNQRFEEDASLILSTVKQSKDEKQEAYIKLLALVTQSYLDKQLAANPKKVPATTKAQIEDLLNKAKEAEGFEASALLEGWNAKLLEEFVSKKVLNTYTALF